MTTNQLYQIAQRLRRQGKTTIKADAEQVAALLLSVHQITVTFEGQTLTLVKDEKPKDGRANNGGGKDRNWSKHRLKDASEGKRVKWATTFKPSHFAFIKSEAERLRCSFADVMDRAIELLKNNSVTKD